METPNSSLEGKGNFVRCGQQFEFYSESFKLSILVEKEAGEESTITINMFDKKQLKEKDPKPFLTIPDQTEAVIDEFMDLIGNIGLIKNHLRKDHSFRMLSRAAEDEDEDEEKKEITKKDVTGEDVKRLTHRPSPPSTTGSKDRVPAKI